MAEQATKMLDKTRLGPMVTYAIVCASLHKGEDPGHDSNFCTSICARRLPDVVEVAGWWEEGEDGWLLWPANPDADQKFRPMSHVVPTGAVRHHGSNVEMQAEARRAAVERMPDRPATAEDLERGDR